MQTGVVKWFNNAKGYGFVLADEDGKDVFAHYSAVDMDGYRTLRAGQCVAFQAVDGPKGLHAVSIKILDEAPDVSGDSSSGSQSLESNASTEATSSELAAESTTDIAG
jgi:CspA family cold shock protein